MKYWICCIFYLANKLSKLCERIDEEIDARSMDLQTDTYALFDAVLALGDKKVRIVNFKVLGRMMSERLTVTDRNIILWHARGAGFCGIAEKLGMSKATVSRRFHAALKVCAAVAVNLTFTEDRLEKEYKDIPLIYKTTERMRKN